MKKVLLITLIFFTVVIIAGAVFLLTLDVNRYRPFIVSRLETALGKPVTVEKIGLSWQDGLALKIHGLAIYSRPEAPQPLFSLESAYAAVNAGALLNRQLQVGDVILKSPEIRLVRLADGSLEGFEKNPAVEPAAPGKGDTAAAAALSFLIRSLELRGGVLIFRDETENPPAEWQLTDVDAELQDIGWGHPSPFNVRASFISGRQNLSVAGKLFLPAPRTPAILKDVHFETDLAAVDLNRLPADQRAQLQKLRLAGKITADAPEVPLEPGVWKTLKSQIRLTDGSMAAPDAPAVEQIELRAGIQGSQLTVDSLSALLAGGEIGASGKIENLDTMPQASFQLTAARMDIAQIAKAKQGEPRPTGRATLLLNAAGSGRNGRQLLTSLQGEGKLALSEVVIHDFNLLREIFDSLSIIPGLVPRLKERLPPDYQKKFEVNETRLAATDIPFQISNGLIAANPIRISTEDFQLMGAATVTLDGNLAAQTMLLIEPQLSAAFIRSVEELRYLANTQGVLQIPIKIQGRLPHVKPFPDLQYVGSRLAVSKAEELIGGFLKPKKEETAAPAPGAPGGPPAPDASAPQTGATPVPSRPLSKEEKVFSILGQILEATGEKSSQSSTQQ